MRKLHLEELSMRWLRFRDPIRPWLCIVNTYYIYITYNLTQTLILLYIVNLLICFLFFKLDVYFVLYTQ